MLACHWIHTGLEGTLNNIALGALALGFVATVAGNAHGQSLRADTLRVAGLGQPVEVLRDRWGVPHIYAKNEHDLFFAQGYSAARDRAFQFEMWRRQATGTMAEVIGKREVQRDQGARLFKYRGNMASELAHWGATRICPIGEMQKPSLLWRHDGRPSLGDLVTWTHLEM